MISLIIDGSWRQNYFVILQDFVLILLRRMRATTSHLDFSRNRALRCLVLLKYLNGYFNIILILILKIFLYEVFKVQ